MKIFLSKFINRTIRLLKDKLDITTNGLYDVSDYKNVNVNVNASGESSDFVRLNDVVCTLERQIIEYDEETGEEIPNIENIYRTVTNIIWDKVTNRISMRIVSNYSEDSIRDTVNLGNSVRISLNLYKNGNVTYQYVSFDNGSQFEFNLIEDVALNYKIPNDFDFDDILITGIYISDIS